MTFPAPAPLQNGSNITLGITIWYHTQIKEVRGDSQLRRAVFADTYTGEETVYETRQNETFGLFILWDMCRKLRSFKTMWP